MYETKAIAILGLIPKKYGIAAGRTLHFLFISVVCLHVWLFVCVCVCVCVCVLLRERTELSVY